MAMSVGGKGSGSMSEINMTPMIDVLLVLLIIFMIMQPLLQKSIDVQIPDEAKSERENPAPQIVLEIDAQGNMAVNQQQVPAGGLEAKLREIYAPRPDKVLFVKADGEVQYQYVIEAMDAARGAGVKVLGGVIPD